MESSAGAYSTGTYTVAVTSTQGRVIKQIRFHDFPYAQFHFDYLVTESKHIPSVIMLYAPTGTVLQVYRVSWLDRYVLHCN